MQHTSPAFPDRLIQGYQTFIDERLPRERSRFQDLATRGQSPEIMLIGCCDSRVSPEVIFDASPGEIFVARNVANLVPPFETGGDYHSTSAALEFAVQALRVKHIVVMGHGRCGGIRAYADDAAPLSPGDFIGKWMTLVKPAADRAGPPAPGEAFDDYVERLAQISVEKSLENLLTFPCIRILHERGKIQLHGAYFDVYSGILRVRDPATGRFPPALPDLPERVSVFGCR